MKTMFNSSKESKMFYTSAGWRSSSRSHSWPRQAVQCLSEEHCMTLLYSPTRKPKNSQMGPYRSCWPECRRAHTDSANSGVSGEPPSPTDSESSRLPRMPPRPRTREILSRCTTYTRKAALATQSQLFPERFDPNN
ncbi:hypothetical protein P4O66_010803 [Electrophorus voltai]|uniref:Uncharacterized protein n=1 Tax=Electrophorus voltai TaxID=2609070 RepID=A0AAD8Z9H1_9TELE|nr:hypothetical protein P4O66_010803 [Electrophorus voltai]